MLHPCVRPLLQLTWEETPMTHLQYMAGMRIAFQIQRAALPRHDTPHLRRTTWGSATYSANCVFACPGGMRPVQVLLVLVLTTVYAKRSPQCPNGCIVASILHPKRECSCVVATCGNPDNPTDPRRGRLAAEPAGNSQGRNTRPQLPHADCDICDRDAFTYNR